MTYADDFVLLNFEHGVVFQLCLALGLEWPPPERIEAFGMPMTRKRFSQITDDQRGEMTHVCRGAEYFTAEAAPMKPEISTPSSSASGEPMDDPVYLCEICGKGHDVNMIHTGSVSSASGDVAQGPQEMLRAALDEASAMLDRCASWIDTIPHDDNCYVTKEPPGNKCVCGKDSLLQAIVDSTAAYASYEPLSEGDGDPHWKPMFAAAAPLTRGVVGGLNSRPPEAAGSDEPRHLTRDEQQMLGRALRRSAKVIDNPATDLAPGLNATNDGLTADDPPRGDAGALIHWLDAKYARHKEIEDYDAARLIEQLQRELREANATIDRGDGEVKDQAAAIDRLAKAEYRISGLHAESQRTIERQRKVIAAADASIAALFDAIKHGDHEHQSWLRDKITEHFAAFAARRELQEGT